MYDAWFLAVVLMGGVLVAITVRCLGNAYRGRNYRPPYRRRSASGVTEWAGTVLPGKAKPYGRRKPAWVRAEVLRLKALMGSVGVRSVATAFNRLHGHRATVGKTFVADLLISHQYELTFLARELRQRPPYRYRVGTVWAMDLTFQADNAKVLHAALGIIDQGSRLLLCLSRVSNRCAWTLLGHLCLAIGRHGKPRAVRSDNEAVFKSFTFRTVLKVLGIRHQTTQPHAPWQNGRIERLFGTLKPLLRQLVFPNGTALDLALTEFASFYNLVRPHQNLGGRTPFEVWQAHSDRAPLPPAKGVPKLIEALGGLLVGYYLRR